MPIARRTFLLSSLTGTLAGLGCDRASGTSAPAPAPSSADVLSTPPAPSASVTAAPSSTSSSAPSAAPPRPSSPPIPGLPPSTDLDFQEIEVPGDRALGRRFLLCVPRHLAAGQRVPVVVLLHGLGETGDERMGAHAWVERYGLSTSYERLRRPPVTRTAKRPEWTDARLAEVNAELEKRPFSGLCLVCPYTPNAPKLPNPAAALDGYAAWITETVLPRVRAEAPVRPDAASTAIDGCSLGGLMALEVFVRRPMEFGALGGVQAAFGDGRGFYFAGRLATALSAGAKPIHLLTSKADAYLDGNTGVAADLEKRGIACDLRVLPGAHNQPFLREAGALEMLLWHDRRPGV